jgi:putative nucleotidyltransferase with HDIG domain
MNPVTSVLIVDDEAPVRELMCRWVESLGFEARTAATAEEAITALTGTACAIAVIDVVMPGKDGLWLAGELRRDYPNTAVVMATGHADLLDGATGAMVDLLVKPFRRERFVLAVDRGREWHLQAVHELQRHARMSIELRDMVAAVVGRLQELRRIDGDESAALVQLACERTADVAAHSERVARFCLSIARELKIPAEALDDIELAARFHDIGKIATPGPVLSKPSPLAPVEVAIMRQHVEAGAEILESTVTLNHLAPLVRASHEWFGGGGYPQNLAGAAIPLASRVITVADAYDAMTQDRAYRGPLGSAAAIAELQRCSPSQFDPKIVLALLSVLGRH